MDGPLMRENDEADDSPASESHGSPVSASLSSREAPEKQTGSMIGVIIIILVLAVGGLYFWGARLNREDSATDPNPSAPSPEEIVEAPDPTLDALTTQRASDDINDIETDLEATELDTLDSDLSDIDTELQF